MLLRCILLTWSHFLLQSYALFAFVLLWFIWNVVDSIFLITAKEHFCFSLQLFWQYLWEGAFPSSSSLAPCYIAELVCAFCGLSLLIQQQKFSFEFQIIKTSLVSFFFLDCTNCWRLFYIFWLKCTLKKNQCFYRT